jgi:hypothetical protein
MGVKIRLCIVFLPRRCENIGESKVTNCHRKLNCRYRYEMSGHRVLNDDWQRLADRIVAQPKRVRRVAWQVLNRSICCEKKQ